MLHHRLVRGYAVLLLGIVLFFARPIFAPDSLDGEPFTGAVATRVFGCVTGAERQLCTEPLIVLGTALVMGLALGWGSLRGLLIAVAFAVPPLLLYITFYPIWIVLIMLLLVPAMAHAALNTWLPAASRSG